MGIMLRVLRALQGVPLITYLLLFPVRNIVQTNILIWYFIKIKIVYAESPSSGLAPLTDNSPLSPVKSESSRRCSGSGLVNFL